MKLNLNAAEKAELLSSGFVEVSRGSMAIVVERGGSAPIKGFTITVVNSYDDLNVGPEDLERCEASEPIKTKKI